MFWPITRPWMPKKALMAALIIAETLSTRR
jgi:hypothetical protein